jgi:hypothetical protein
MIMLQCRICWFDKASVMELQTAWIKGSKAAYLVLCQNNVCMLIQQDKTNAGCLSNTSCTNTVLLKLQDLMMLKVREGIT